MAQAVIRRFCVASTGMVEVRGMFASVEWLLAGKVAELERSVGERPREALSKTWAGRKTPSQVVEGQNEAAQSAWAVGSNCPTHFLARRIGDWLDSCGGGLALTEPEASWPERLFGLSSRSPGSCLLPLPSHKAPMHLKPGQANLDPLCPR